MRAVIEFQIEGDFEIEIPRDSSESEIEKQALYELKKMAGCLSADITSVRVAAIGGDKP